MNRNSNEESRNTDVRQIRRDLTNSGYSHKQLAIAESRAKAKFDNQNLDQRTIPHNTPIILSTLYFINSHKLRGLLHHLTDDMKLVTGDEHLKPILANKRGQNIGDRITRNKDFHTTPRSHHTGPVNQRCNSSRCLFCQLFTDTLTSAEAGGFSHTGPGNLNCKSRNTIYFAQCNLCKNSQGSYTGQSQQHLHRRINGHRHDFYKQPHKSALAYHSTVAHNGKLLLEA